MFQSLRRMKARLAAEDRGASLVEYAMLMALIAFVCIGALTYFGNESGNSAQTSADCIEAAYAGNTVPAECND